MEEVNKIVQIIYCDFPEFRNTPNRVNDYGWDNMVFIADERVVFRIPRNELSRKQMQVELHLLPQIAEVSPLPVPVYKYFSQEEGLYAGYDLIPGIPFEKYIFDKCSKEQQSEIAKFLGGFLSAVHSLAVNEADISNLPVRRQSRQSWLDLQAEVLSKAAAVLEPIHKQRIEDMFNFILYEIDFDELPKTLIHGDFSSDHIIYDVNYQDISGIIDFGDLMIGDPAYDFTGILLEYDSEFLEKLLYAYQIKIDARFLERVEKFYTQKVPLHHLLNGIDHGDEVIVAQALSNLLI